MQSLNNDLVMELEQLLSPKCAFCNQEMEISEGDVIYDAKWYHKSCWEFTERKQAQKSTPPDDSSLISIPSYA